MPLSSFIPSILVMAFCIIMSAYFSANRYIILFSMILWIKIITIFVFDTNMEYNI